MGWGILLDKDDDGLRGRMTYFCNTADVPFGSVYYVRGSLSKSEFYSLWNIGRFGDARNMDEERLDNITRRILYFLNDGEINIKVRSSDSSINLDIEATWDSLDYYLFYANDLPGEEEIEVMEHLKEGLLNFEGDGGEFSFTSDTTRFTIEYTVADPVYWDY